MLALAAPASAQKLAIKAGRVITMAGEDIENGVILIGNGRIEKVGGADLEVPWDAEVLEHPDLVAFPGFVEAHTFQGMDRPNENLDVAPFLDIRDSLDPVSFYFQDSLRWGVTTINVQQGNACVIGAMGMVVKPHGMTVEEMLVSPGSGLKLSASPKQGKSRATQAQAMRVAFGELRRYLEELVQEKKDGDDRARREALYQGREPEEGEEKDKGKPMAGKAWTVPGLEAIPRWQIDEKQVPLLDLVEGNTDVFFFCGAPADVETAVEIARDNGFLHRTKLVLGSACWKAADEVAAAGVPVILSSSLVHVERDPVTGEEIETFVPGVFKEKGITFALQSADQSTHSLWFQAARCIAYGLTREEALASVTTTPAKMLGLEKDVGSLEAGKIGNVVLFSGDPLSSQSLVEYVLLDGRLVYDRSTDVRAKHLLEGVQPEGTAPEGAQEGEHAHDDEQEGEKKEEKKEDEKKDEGEEDD
jgi:imidazolonepropionase-like amidohydrolase